MGDWNDPAQAWTATNAAIRSGDVTLFEATLLLGRRMARVDILERRGNTLRLIEVKAKPYAALQPLIIAGVEQAVAEGTEAIRAYEALTFGAERHDAAVQAAWRLLLLEYCKLDTLAMVLIWEYWGRVVGLPSSLVYLPGTAMI